MLCLSQKCITSATIIPITNVVNIPEAPNPPTEIVLVFKSNGATVNKKQTELTIPTVVLSKP